MQFINLLTTPTGAKLLKAKDGIAPDLATALLKEVAQLNFIQEFGRGTAWLGERGLDYRYAGRSHIAQGVTPIISVFSAYLNQLVDEEYNHILVNQYKPGQSLNKHKDDEKELKGSIASLSLGAPAFFDYTADKVKLLNGDLLVGNRQFFNELPHGVSQPLGTPARDRYNITWRTISK